jgi:Flp pilus assembly protein CpaB
MEAWMSRRARAIAFGLAALIAAAAAGTIADGYGDSVARGYGALRPVVVAATSLPAGKVLDPTHAEADLEVRRVPARFVPAGALRDPAEALGLVPAAAISSGAYLIAAQLRPPRSDAPGPALGGGRRPVQIAVSGADALAVGGADPVGSRIDVVITTEPDDGGDGSTYVAAADVPLLGLGASPEGDVAGAAEATLGLTRRQALRLIAAESFARQVTVMPRGGR